MGFRKTTHGKIKANFFINLNMGEGTNLLNFLNNEKRILKLKLGNKSIKKERLNNGNY